MDIIGNIKLISETEEGTSKAGKTWAKRQIVVTTSNDKYPQDIAIDFLDKVEANSSKKDQLKMFALELLKRQVLEK